MAFPAATPARRGRRTSVGRAATPEPPPRVDSTVRTRGAAGEMPEHRSTWIPDLLGPLQRVAEGSYGQLIAGIPALRPAPTAEQQAIAAAISASLTPYVLAHRLGRVYVAPWCILSRFPPTVLACELALVRATRADTWDGYIPLIPDLVVEVLQRTQRYLDVVDRVEAWLAAGTRLVLIVNPRRRSIGLHSANGVRLVRGRQQAQRRGRRTRLAAAAAGDLRHGAGAAAEAADAEGPTT